MGGDTEFSCGDGVAIGYCIDLNDLFTHLLDREEHIDGYESFSDTDDVCGVEDEQCYNPLQDLRKSWIAFLEGHGHADLLDRGIRPHVGATDATGKRDSRRPKCFCKVVFGVKHTTWRQRDDEVLSTVDTEIVVQPAVTLPTSLRDVVAAFITWFTQQLGRPIRVSPQSLRLARVFFVR